MRETPKNTPSLNLRNLDNSPPSPWDTLFDPLNLARKSPPKLGVGNSLRGRGESWKTDFSYFFKSIFYLPK